MKVSGKNNLFVSVVLFFLFSLSSIIVQAQEIERCGFSLIRKTEQAKNKSLENNLKRFEEAIVQQIASNQQNARISNEIIRIPVVVHIIHNRADGAIGGERNPNISDEQVYSQIKVLNEDYRRKPGSMGYNSNPAGADMEIEFFLVTTDPNGNPTKGITRHYYNKSSFNIDREREIITNLSRWDPNKYLNIYVAKYSNQIIGWGEFPGAANFDGLESEDPQIEIDGVFIDHTTFGRQIGTANTGIYKFGRTTTHEIGHWMGLIHTWGDEYCGTDYVADTPPTATSNNTDKCTPKFSTCNGVRTQNMIENFLDYSPDSCMNVFTEGQKQRARAALEVSKRRKRVVEFGKFQLPTSATLQVKMLPNPSTVQDAQIQVLLPDFQDFTIELYDILGRKLYSETYKDFPSTIIKLKSEKISAGNYILVVTSKNEVVKQRIFLGG